MATLEAFRDIIENEWWFTLKDGSYHYVKKRKTSFKKNTFTKYIWDMKNNDQWLMNELWPVYFGYMSYLVKRMRYGSIIEFEELDFLWLSKTSITSFRWRLKELWLVKKMKRYWYIHPGVAYKWETIENEVIELFFNEILWTKKAKRNKKTTNK